MSLGRQIVVFGLSSAASRLAAILLVPLYTRTLSILEYGQLEVMLALYALFVIVVGLQGESAVARDFFEARTAGTQSLLSAGSLVMAAAGTGLLAVIMACGVALDWWPDGVAQALPLLLAMALATQILGVQLVILRFAGAPLFFATVSFLDLFIAASTSVVMIVVLHWGITGALAGILVGKTVCIALAWSRSFGWSVRHGTTRTTLSAMTRYALPTMPAVLLNWLQTNGNRVLLAAFLAFQDVALAGIALKVAALYGFLTYAFRLAWEPYSFERLGSFDDDRQIFNRALQVYVVAMFAIAGAATIASPLLMAMLAPPVYASATKLSGLFILGQFWIGAVPILAIGVHGARVTSRLTYVYAIGAIVNVAAIAVLAHMIGAAAAAVGFLVSAIITALATAYYSNRHFATGFDRAMLAWAVGATAVFGAASYGLLATFDTGIPAVSTIAVTLAALAAVLTVLIAVLVRFAVDRRIVGRVLSGIARPLFAKVADR